MLEMDFYESDLEDILWSCLKSKRGIEVLNERGLEIGHVNPSLLFRQLRIGKYGIADIVTVKRKLHKLDSGEHIPLVTVTVFELKKEKINLNSLVQIFRYIKGIERYLQIRGTGSCSVKIKGVLIGKTMNLNGEWLLMSQYLGQLVEFYSYDYTIHGMEFNRFDVSNVALIDEGF